MDLNLTVLAGRLATSPELKEFESGSRMAKLLITVRSSEPRHRVDVLPVVWWNPDMDVISEMLPGDAVWVAGAAQRRFWSQEGSGRRSNVEIVALEVSIRKATEELEEVG